MKHILSLGAGVQSSTIAMMAKHGEITPMPDAAIFADVGAEPQAVYDYLDWLEKELPFPVHRVMHEEGVKQPLYRKKNGKRYATPPFYAGTGLLMRQCTREYKVQPIDKKIREIVGLKPRQRAPKNTILSTQWIGISWDEMQRMKDHHRSYVKNRWPLIEMRMTRGHCLEWMKKHGYPEPPRSACTFCPYRSNHEWRLMRDKDPQAWQEALEVDELIRDGISGTTETLYVHRSTTPLADADLTDPHENQQTFSFMDECDGLCGV